MTAEQRYDRAFDEYCTLLHEGLAYLDWQTFLQFDLVRRILGPTFSTYNNVILHFDQ